MIKKELPLQSKFLRSAYFVTGYTSDLNMDVAGLCPIPNVHLWMVGTLKEAPEKTKLIHDVKQRDDGGALTSVL